MIGSLPFDVVVAGGGPAGISAAVSAARAGASVLLLERHDCLGGVWTSGLLSYVFDFDKSEIGWEIIRRLDALGGRRPDRTDAYPPDRDWVYEPEYMKFVCEEMCREAGVHVLLGSPVVAAERDASGRNIASVSTESKSGRRVWAAAKFIDCTGDGDLGALAGCGFDCGYPGLAYGQPATLNALVAVDDGDALAPFVSNEPAMWTRDTLPDGTEESHHICATRRLMAVLREQGVEPSYGDPTLFRIHRNVFCFMANHEYGLRVDDAEAISEATMRARREIVGLAAALARRGGPWKGFRVIATAEQIGHRDARRIHGLYTVTKEDIERGATFTDAVTTSRFGIDIHGLDLKMNRVKAAGDSGGVRFRPFQIPLRACVAKDVGNLYMAGRCISGDFHAHASYRVTGSAVAIGEAVGKAAAESGNRAMGQILEIEPQEVLRYLRLGGNAPGAALSERIDVLRADALKAACPKRAFLRFPLSHPVVSGWLEKSQTLARHLGGCHAVYLVCGTLGARFDALLRRAGVKSAADALVLQAIGTAAIEEWMDAVEGEVKSDLRDGETMLRRYSPGYGDFPLAAQRELLGLLEAARRIGVFLTETFLMIPSKSVSAVIGVRQGD